MTRKQVLGRGLSALLPGKEAVPRGTSTQELDIGLLIPGRFQPRRDFAAGALDELAASIREQGVVQPVLVVPRGEKFEIVAGERRWRAAAQAGLKRIPVVVREKRSDKELLEIALVENLQREDLNPLEAATAYARLKEEFQLTQEGLAEEIVRRALSVRQTEARVAALAQGPKLKRPKHRDPFTRDAEEKLSR